MKRLRVILGLLHSWRNQQTWNEWQCRQVGPGGPLRHAALPDNYRIQIITKTMHFYQWNVFDDMCRMGQWLFGFWFDINRYTFEDDMCEKNDFNFLFQVNLTFDFFDLKLVTLVQSCFHKITSFYSVPFSRNRRHAAGGRADGWTTVQRLMRPPRENRIIMLIKSLSFIDYCRGWCSQSSKLAISGVL